MLKGGVGGDIVGSEDRRAKGRKVGVLGRVGKGGGRSIRTCGRGKDLRREVREGGKGRGKEGQEEGKEDARVITRNRWLRGMGDIFHFQMTGFTVWG